MFMITSPRRLALVVVDVSVSPDEDLFGSERNLVPSWRVVPQPRLGAVITNSTGGIIDQNRAVGATSEANAGAAPYRIEPSQTQPCQSGRKVSRSHLQVLN